MAESGVSLDSKVQLVDSQNTNTTSIVSTAVQKKTTEKATEKTAKEEKPSVFINGKHPKKLSFADDEINGFSGLLKGLLNGTTDCTIDIAAYGTKVCFAATEGIFYELYAGGRIVYDLAKKPFSLFMNEADK